MFTESDDMFAADFDVSALGHASALAVLALLSRQAGNREGVPSIWHSLTRRIAVLLCRAPG